VEAVTKNRKYKYQRLIDTGWFNTHHHMTALATLQVTVRILD